MARIVKGVATFVRILSLSILSASAKAALLFAGVGLIYIIPLFCLHPELTDDTLAMSLIIVLASFGLWSRVFFWAARLSKRYRESEQADSSPIRRIVAFLAIFALLFLGPAFLIAGTVMSLAQLTSSAQVAFLIAKLMAQIDGIIFCVVVLAILNKGSVTIAVPRSDVERFGQGSMLQDFGSIYGLLRQAFR